MDPSHHSGRGPDFPDVESLKALLKEEDPSILEEAQRIVYGAREEDYGHPYDNFTQIAALWSAYKGVEFKPEDVAAFFILTKMSREDHKANRDNRVDMAGYAGTWDRVIQERERRGGQ
jgi:hypothetical protein